MKQPRCGADGRPLAGLGVLGPVTANGCEFAEEGCAEESADGRDGNLAGARRGIAAQDAWALEVF